MAQSPDLNELSAGSINLLKLLPRSSRWIYRRVTPYMFWFVLSVFGLIASRSAQLQLRAPTLTGPAQRIFIALSGGTLFLVVFKYISLKLGSRRFRVGIEGEHLVFSRGIFFKQRGAFPLSRISEVYIFRDPLDLLFGLYNLQISTPSSASSQIARVAGLTKEQAIKLQEIILSFLDRSHFVPHEEEPVETKKISVRGI